MKANPGSTRSSPVPNDAASLVGVYVWAKPFDDLAYRHELHKGTVMAEKFTGGVCWVLFQSAELVGQKWIPANRITGRAQYVPATQKAAS